MGQGADKEENNVVDDACPYLKTAHIRLCAHLYRLKSLASRAEAEAWDEAAARANGPHNFVRKFRHWPRHRRSPLLVLCSHHHHQQI
jgi:hypothetical protein